MDPALVIKWSIVLAGWPVLVFGAVLQLLAAFRFRRSVGNSVIGNLVVTMVAGWIVTMVSLGLISTLWMFDDPSGAVPWVLPVFALWGATFALLNVTSWRWSRQVTTINSFYIRLAEMNEFRSRLMNTAAHELNTPMTPIRLHLHRLTNAKAGELSPSLQKSVSVLNRSFDRLAGMIHNILDAQRVQHGKLSLQVAPTNVGDVVRNVVREYAEAATVAGVRLTSSTSGDLLTQADAARMGQVLENLVNNAIRFTPRGGLVAVSASRVGESIAVAVEDTGAGLTPADLRTIFLPFGHAHDPKEDARVGAGLGLYIAQGILAQHDGRITAESKGRGLGSRFSLSIPARKAA